MNRIILAICAITTIVFSSFGQAPEAFKYQAVIRDASGTILTNQAVGIQFTIIQGSIVGAAVYTETHTPTTNAYGLVNLEIGNGTTIDDFTTIDWANNGPFFLETAVDAAGGTSYTTMGTSQFLSVPYALYAKSSGPNGTLDQTMYHDGTEWVSTNNLSNNGTTVSTDADMQINGLTVGRGGGNIDGNAAHGKNALYSNTSGFRNTATGAFSLTSNILGERNTATGAFSLTSNITGSANTANGANALFSNTTGSSNTANGLNALYSNTIGNHNTANGVNALYFNTEGVNNTAIGMSALYLNNEGYNNTAIGKHALSFNTDGSSNTAIGMYALYYNTEGINNAANGTSALSSNTTGIRNTANGANALYSNTIGDYNTANGSLALYLSTEGSNNTANGIEALYSNTIGIGNTANGANALSSNTIGDYNTALGFGANVASGSLINATAIGANAEVAASNKIQLGDINVTSVATSGALTTGAVTYPNIDGTAGQLLTTDGLGTVSWTTFTGGGATGPTGPAGAAGTTGAVGPTGPAGAAGTTGAVGPTGPSGAAGTTGAVGPTGPAGADGTTGAVGPTGPPGIDGQGGVTIAGTNVAITGTGTTSDPYIVNSSYTEPIYTIGFWPELGGYVFRISSDGKHGLVAEIFDQGSTDLYEAQNMISNPSNHSTDGQIFMDWRMPTKYELNEMYLQKASIGFFAADEYWSSTEENSQTAWHQNFDTGSVADDPMSYTGHIRSVREF